MFSQVERKCPFRSVPDVLAVHSGRIGPGRQELGLDGKERVKVLTSNRIQNSLKGLIYPFLAAHNDVGMDLAWIYPAPACGLRSHIGAREWADRSLINAGAQIAAHCRVDRDHRSLQPSALSHIGATNPDNTSRWREQLDLAVAATSREPMQVW